MATHNPTLSDSVWQVWKERLGYAAGVVGLSFCLTNTLGVGQLMAVQPMYEASYLLSPGATLGGYRESECNRHRAIVATHYDNPFLENVTHGRRLLAQSYVNLNCQM